MSKADKTIGRIKQAAGDLVDDAELRQKGREQEHHADTRDEAARAQERADAKRREVSDLERKTS
jgi:uncharacterized protein YjbJ (UPF0337 family)